MLLRALVVALGIQLGARVYEHTAMMPAWNMTSHGTLADALLGSGQTGAVVSFWRFVSPTVALLALANTFAAASANASAR